MASRHPTTKAGKRMAISNRVTREKQLEAENEELKARIIQLEDRCDNLQDEINALENPPHQLCGHSAGNCKC